MSYIITSTKLKNIADAVRYKCGGYLMNITTMISKLSQLQQGNGLIDVSRSSGEMALWNAVRIATFDTVHDGAEYHRIINPSTMTTMYGMFAGWPLTGTLNFQNFGDTSNVTDMYQMFQNNKATQLTNLTSFNTSQVTRMYQMFQGCTNLTSLDLSGWNLSHLSSGWDGMNNMFSNCKSLRSIDLSGWAKSGSVSNVFSNMRNAGGKIWVPSTFRPTGLFNCLPVDPEALTGQWRVYTDVPDAQSQPWGTINQYFTIYYNSTHQDFLNA